MYHRESNIQCGRMAHGGHEAWAQFRKHFGDNIPEKMGRQFQAGMSRKGRHGRKSVNMIETADAYLLNLYAAGLKKDLFSITIDDDVLTIRYQPEAEDNGTKYIYEEYRPVAFERAFRLNDKVLKDGIGAAYTDGVLEVTLPKNPEAHKPGQVIEVE